MICPVMNPAATGSVAVAGAGMEPVAGCVGVLESEQAARSVAESNEPVRRWIRIGTPEVKMKPRSPALVGERVRVC
jgi:hypothetical protein